MSLYGEYIKEREGYDIVENDKGFATFTISGVECYLRDIYVRPDFRKQDVASELAREVEKQAADRGATILIGSCCVGMRGDTESLKVLLAYGFRVRGVEGNMIYFDKEIN